ncbi:hypothetical protein ACFW6Q_09745 [Streptomyces sp. NPDC058737]|uniref:hypothetical protein n=1 Tax=Streptomyces sp. NPDC058737 TaxID=3346617 RepID=UPI0036A1E08D
MGQRLWRWVTGLLAACSTDGPGPEAGPGFLLPLGRHPPGRLSAYTLHLVVKDGTADFRTGMRSCGPFRLTEFTPGQGSPFERYDDHYGHVPHLVSAPARAGALTSGEIDFAHDLSPVTAFTLDDNDAVEFVPRGAPAWSA